MNNLRVLVRCDDEVAQNSGFRRPPLTSPLGYKQTFSRSKLRSALPPRSRHSEAHAGLPLVTRRRHSCPRERARHAVKNLRSEMIVILCRCRR